MVVVVIIGILVAIAVPIYNNIQETARENAHEANIRTIQGVIEVYKADNEGTAPTKTADLVPDYLLEWPAAPTGHDAADYLAAAGGITLSTP